MVAPKAASSTARTIAASPITGRKARDTPTVARMGLAITHPTTSATYTGRIHSHHRPHGAVKADGTARLAACLVVSQRAVPICDR